MEGLSPLENKRFVYTSQGTVSTYVRKFWNTLSFSPPPNPSLIRLSVPLSFPQSNLPPPVFIQTTTTTMSVMKLSRFLLPPFPKLIRSAPINFLFLGYHGPPAELIPRESAPSSFPSSFFVRLYWSHQRQSGWSLKRGRWPFLANELISPLLSLLGGRAKPAKL